MPCGDAAGLLLADQPDLLELVVDDLLLEALGERNRLRLVGIDEGDQLLPTEAANMVGEREQERGADATSTEVGQHTRGDEAAAREMRAGSDAAAGQVAVELGEEEQPALLVRRVDLLGRDRLVRDDRALETRPRVEIGAGVDHAKRRRYAHRAHLGCDDDSTTTRRR